MYHMKLRWHVNGHYLAATSYVGTYLTWGRSFIRSTYPITTHLNCFAQLYSSWTPSRDSKSYHPPNLRMPILAEIRVLLNGEGDAILEAAFCAPVAGAVAAGTWYITTSTMTPVRFV
jgi:hypothetical protein